MGDMTSWASTRAMLSASCNQTEKCRKLASMMT